MEFTVEQIASLLNGKVEGDRSVSIRSLAKIEEGSPGSLSFLSNPKYEPHLYTTQASAVIVNEQFVPKKAVQPALIYVKDAYSAFTALLQEYNKYLNAGKTGAEEPSFISPTSAIGEGYYRGAFSYVGEYCSIGTNVKIYPQAYVGNNVRIGDNTVIYAGARIYDNTVIGSDCVIHAGAVIGSDGFGFAPQADGTYQAIPQVGNVVLEDQVSIGANTVIDRATMGQTIIRRGTKLDNLIQVAHNVEIGRNTVIAAQTGVSGSTKIGDNCVIGGQVGFVGHIKVADRTSIGAQSGVGRSIIKPGTALQGSPAFDYKDNLKSAVIFRKLPQLKKRLEELEEKIVNLLNSGK
jgi:UDP-3-O-[3-hydroxymyristoyl] glucosamine N-acyltransferase